ncbi:HAD family hydrolase [Actinopolyspora mortivallis]|uniref:Haloacid dehalogenase n=1 Tax=Actinopolyspora mortivallis TaxID=33906 RepID=A0A2T0GRT8_ACTMO|nr:HAD family phosphatase [Actinopolyspora mortivallis]PRW61826.1 haloacid dehalogenase [Actinopolyspora mortivallis]
MRTEPAVDAVVFDYGGVLTAPGEQAVESWTRAEGIRRESFTTTLREWAGRDAPEGTPLHRLETGELALEEFNELLAARLRREDGTRVPPAGLLERLFSFMPLDERMLDLVRSLRKEGLRTALLSNSWGNSYPWDRIGPLFEQAVISGEVGMRKPDPEIYRLLSDRMELSPERILFVDDLRANTAAAQRTGMRAVLHHDVERTRRDVREHLDGAQRQQHGERG